MAEALLAIYTCGAVLLFAGASTTGELAEPKRGALHLLVAVTWPVLLVVVLGAFLFARFSSGPSDPDPGADHE